jgi:hypothetical protein
VELPNRPSLGEDHGDDFSLSSNKDFCAIVDLSKIKGQLVFESYANMGTTKLEPSSEDTMEQLRTTGRLPSSQAYVSRRI